MDYSTIKRVPDGHWNDIANHKAFASFLSTKLGFTTLHDWYKISATNIKTYRGAGLLISKYDGQTLKFVQGIFPEETWYPWLFEIPIKNFWNIIDTQKDYLKWISNKENWSSSRDFYKLTLRFLNNNYGGGLLKYYNSSVIQILTALIDPPEGDEEWYPWLFDGSTPNNYWDDKKNQRKYLSWLFKRLNFTCMEDWYKVDQQIFCKNYGSGLVLSKMYNSSHIKLLQQVYGDEYTFLPWLFKQAPQGYWKDNANRLYFMKWLGKTLNYNTAEDWYGITREIINNNHGRGLAIHYYSDNVVNMVIDLNPHLTFDITKFNRHKTEVILEQFLRSLNIKYNKQYVVCKGKKNGVYRCDFLLTDLNICIELDGGQHFRQVHVWLDPDLQTKRDVYKMVILKEKGIRCIRILQEDVIRHQSNWLNEYLVPHLTLDRSLDPIYVDTSEQDLYKKHKEMMSSDISIVFDDLYDD
jgi:very-short-patch-repair endonuclease